jgi:hypothetical protein
VYVDPSVDVHNVTFESELVPTIYRTFKYRVVDVLIKTVDDDDDVPPEARACSFPSVAIDIVAMFVPPFRNVKTILVPDPIFMGRNMNFAHTIFPTTVIPFVVAVFTPDPIPSRYKDSAPASGAGDVA